MKIIKISYSELASWNRAITNVISNNYWEEDLNPSTKMYDDLKMYGDDTYELLELLSKKFKIDFSQFESSKFIHPEGVSLFGLFRKKEITDITIGDLITSAILGIFTERKDVKYILK